MIDRNFVRSDEDPSQKPGALEIDSNGRQDTDNTEANPSNSLVKIDLYGQDRSEYIYTSLLTGLI